MFNHYLGLAIRSLRHNLVLSTLMIAAIGVGIGASMTVFTILSMMSRDPIPEKSSQLFVPQIDNWGPEGQGDTIKKVNKLPDRLAYRDALALMQAKHGLRQTAMYPVRFSVLPSRSGTMPFMVGGRAVYADFFGMFLIPWRKGAVWSASDEDGRANVVVISAKLADRLFPGSDPVGQSINLDQRDYRIVGVVGNWDPQPRYYDVINSRFAESEDVFLPFPTAIDRHVATAGNLDCLQAPSPVWTEFLSSECIWVGFWVELPSAAAAREYREFLDNYAADQLRSGRFHWPPRTALLDVRHWLRAVKVVPDEVRFSTVVAFGFLFVCLIDAAGLMLAKVSTRSDELAVRRAVGASKVDIFAQCVVETGVVGTLGGILGLCLTTAGIWLERSILPEDIARVTHLDVDIVLTTLVLAILAAVCSGMYPAWHASRLQPASRLKTQ